MVTKSAGRVKILAPYVTLTIMISDVLNDEKFGYISDPDRKFIDMIDAEFERLGYTCSGETVEGHCWGNDMIIYRKKGVKSDKSYARIYLRDDGLVLRLYFSKVDKHREFIEKAKPHIKEVFVGDFGKCKHCKYSRDDNSCRFQKIYTIDGRRIEKCNGATFWFQKPKMEFIPDYIELFEVFYPKKRSMKNA